MKLTAAIKKPNAVVKWLRVISFAGAWFGGAIPLAVGESAPARFWITNDPDNPFVVDEPTIEAPLGVETTLYIWARPATDDAGNLKILQNFSLNLVVPDGRLLDPMNDPVNPVVDFLDDRIHVYNDEFSGKQRFQFVQDSTHAPPPDFDFLLKSNCLPGQELACMPDGIGGLEGTIQGFSIPDPDKPAEVEKYVGIGHPEDPLRKTAVGRLPAWLIGEVGFKTVRPEGTNPYFLQIGFNGMSHRGERAADTKVVFSLEQNAPVYDVGNEEHRQWTFAEDMPDVWIAVPPPRPGDFGGDGTVGPEDFWAWKTAFGEAVDPPGSGPDGNRNGNVDAADYTLWRDHLNVKVGNFNRDRDVGVDDYELWKDTFGDEVARGTFADGNGNGFVDAADYTVWRDNLSPRLGDFDANDVVNDDDYSNWRETFGQTVPIAGTGADWNWNGVVDSADYTIWRDRWGTDYSESASRSGGLAPIHQAAVPEPVSSTLSLAIFIFFGVRRPLNAPI